MSGGRSAALSGTRQSLFLLWVGTRWGVGSVVRVIGRVSLLGQASDSYLWNWGFDWLRGGPARDVLAVPAGWFVPPSGGWCHGGWAGCRAGWCCLSVAEYEGVGVEEATPVVFCGVGTGTVGCDGHSDGEAYVYFFGVYALFVGEPLHGALEVVGSGVGEQGLGSVG